jgi:hypothetical protein
LFSDIAKKVIAACRSCRENGIYEYLYNNELIFLLRNLEKVANTPLYYTQYKSEYGKKPHWNPDWKGMGEDI